MKADYHVDVADYFIRFTPDEIELLRGGSSLTGTLPFLSSSSTVLKTVSFQVSVTDKHPISLLNSYTSQPDDAYVMHSDKFFYVERLKDAHLHIYNDPDENDGIWLIIGTLGLEERFGGMCKMVLSVETPFVLQLT